VLIAASTASVAGRRIRCPTGRVHDDPFRATDVLRGVGDGIFIDRDALTARMAEPSPNIVSRRVGLQSFRSGIAIGGVWGGGGGGGGFEFSLRPSCQRNEAIDSLAQLNQIQGRYVSLRVDSCFLAGR